MYLTKVVQNSKIKIWKKFSWKFRIRIFIRAGFNIFRIFWIFCICRMYEPFMSKNFWVISNARLMGGHLLHNLPSVLRLFREFLKLSGYDYLLITRIGVRKYPCLGFQHHILLDLDDLVIFLHAMATNRIRH